MVKGLDGLEATENRTNEGLSVIYLWGQKRVIVGTGIIHSTAHNTYNGGISLDNKEGLKYNFGVKLDKYSLLLKHNKEDGFQAPEFEIEKETPDFLKNPMQDSKEDSETFSKTFGLTEEETKAPNVRDMLEHFQEALNSGKEENTTAKFISTYQEGKHPSTYYMNLQNPKRILTPKEFSDKLDLALKDKKKEIIRNNIGVKANANANTATTTATTTK